MEGLGPGGEGASKGGLKTPSYTGYGVHSEQERRGYQAQGQGWGHWAYWWEMQQ